MPHEDLSPTLLVLKDSLTCVCSWLIQSSMQRLILGLWTCWSAMLEHPSQAGYVGIILLTDCF